VLLDPGSSAAPRAASQDFSALAGLTTDRTLGGAFVETYIVLANYTDQGMRTILNSPNRLDGTKKVLEKLGGRQKDFWLTVGSHDLVAVIEVPDDATLAKFTLALGALGNVRTESLKAFSEAEYRQIILGSRDRPNPR
jgi:uncharacterized protein with GYD domain